MPRQCKAFVGFARLRRGEVKRPLKFRLSRCRNNRSRAINPAGCDSSTKPLRNASRRRPADRM